MKFRFVMKKILLTKMRYNFVSGVVGMNQSLKKCKQTGMRYRDKHVGGNNTGIY